MSCQSITNTSRALYRVFIAPTLSPRLQTSQHAPILFRPRPVLAQGSIRSLHGKRPAKRQALSDYFTFDNAIKSPVINLIDEKGAFRSNVSRDDVLFRMRRVTHHLLLLHEGKVDEFGDPDPAHPPTCKIVTKIDLRAQHNKKLEIERRAAKGQGAGPSSKNLELNWAIAEGDLKHRLEKFKGFLKEGRKVEVLLGPKKRGKRKATPEECDAVLKAIAHAVGECKGAGEMKRSGLPGGVMTLVFEGRKLEEKKPKDEAEVAA